MYHLHLFSLKSYKVELMDFLRLQRFRNWCFHVIKNPWICSGPKLIVVDLLLIWKHNKLLKKAGHKTFPFRLRTKEYHSWRIQDLYLMISIFLPCTLICHLGSRTLCCIFQKRHDEKQMHGSWKTKFWLIILFIIIYSLIIPW